MSFNKSFLGFVSYKYISSSSQNNLTRVVFPQPIGPINNNILLYLTIIFGILFIIFVTMLAYYNNKTAGIINIFR